MWFPLFVNLKDKKVLVIGGGKVAFKKISKILEYEADITVITENIAEEKLTNVIKELVPFIASNFIVLAIVTYVPAVTIGVVKLIMGN